MQNTQDRVILHCDLNNFYATVEQTLDPVLKGKPIAVAGDPEKRHGIILAKSNEAKKYGIKTAEAIWEAKQKCPDLILVPPHYKVYCEYSKKVRAIYTDFTSEVESFGLDECWLDVTGSRRLFGTGEEIADRIRNRVKEETGLTVSVGVSFTKVFAKLGSDYKKPDAVTVFDRENYRDIVWKLPVEEMLYIGRKTAVKLKQVNIRTIGDLAKADRNFLIKLFGKVGETMHKNACGEETEEVKSYLTHRIPDSVGTGTTPPEDVKNLWDASAVIYALAEMIAFRLRQYERVGEGISLHVRDVHLKSFSRQAKMRATDSAEEIAREAIDLLTKHYDFDTEPPLRTVTIGVHALREAGEYVQTDFFESPLDAEKKARIGMKIDKLRDKYGFNVIRRGINVGTIFQCDGKDAEDGYKPFDRG